MKGESSFEVRFITRTPGGHCETMEMNPALIAGPNTLDIGTAIGHALLRHNHPARLEILARAIETVATYDDKKFARNENELIKAAIGFIESPGGHS